MEQPVEPGNDEVIHFLPIINILLGRLGFIVKSSLVVMAIVWGYTLFKPPLYTTSIRFLPASSTAGQVLSIRSPQNNDIDLSNSIPDYYTIIVNGNDFLAKAYQRLDAEENRKYAALKPMFAVIVDSGHSGEQKVTLPNVALAVRNIAGKGVSVQILSLDVTALDQQASKSLAEFLMEEFSDFIVNERATKALADLNFIKNSLDFSERELKHSEAELSRFLMRNKNIATPRLKEELAAYDRSVKVQEEIYTILRKQYEQAKIRVQENKSELKIIEMVTTENTRSRHKKLIAVSGLGALLLFSAWVYLRHRWLIMDETDADVREFKHRIHEILADVVRPLRPLMPVFRKFGSLLGISGVARNTR